MKTMSAFLRYGYLTWQAYDLVAELLYQQCFAENDSYKAKARHALDRASKRLERRAVWTGMEFVL